MRRPVLIARPTRISRHHIALPRPTVRANVIERSNIITPTRHAPIKAESTQPTLDFQPDPYLDYGRYLTNKGGILIIYKDFDVRFRHTLWRLFAWTLFTIPEGMYLAPYSPVQDHWTGIASLLAIAVANFLIVKKPVELYRRIEIRPDCIIVEDSDVFWRRHMEGGMPRFQPDDEGNQILCGIYGTRFVEYLTVRRFDESDRMMEVFAAHLQDAMQQQWSRPQL